MFAKYKIDLNEIISFVGGTKHFSEIIASAKFQEWVSKQYDAYPYDILNPMVYGKDGNIRADIVSEQQFPILKNKHVFVSHSSKDGDAAKVLALFLKITCGINCFIDSMIWNNIADLQKELDGKYCWLRKEDKVYDYNKRNNSTAHVHAMLSTALFEMIDSCECAIFIESQNSTIKLEDIKNQSTFSPWIYEEINYINKIRENTPKRYIGRKQLKVFSVGGKMVNESMNIPIVYPLSSINEMRTIDAQTLRELNERSKFLQKHEGLTIEQLAEPILDTLYINTGFIKAPTIV